MAIVPRCFCGLLFGRVSVGRNFAEFQKMCDESVLAKFAIARLYGHFGSRGLQQNVVLCLHFKSILITRLWHLRQGVFVALFLEEFPLVATMKNFRKCAMRVFPSKFAIARLFWHFGSRGLPQNFVLCLHFKCILIQR